MPQPHDEQFLSRALELAEQGRGHVEPNPMVGAVIVREGKIVGGGWHQQFGSPHAEINALAAAGEKARGAEIYVTLEPCCHHGKTPPCTDALIKAGVSRVIVGCFDPNPQVAGQGVAKLRDAGITVDVREHHGPARRLIAPFAKLITTGKPWVIAKWAMTLDGKIATHTGSSQWISSEASRAVVHRIRGGVDAILVGRVTVERDDPLLTARPAGPRIATRIVLDSEASMSMESQLVRTAAQAPLIIVARENAATDCIARLEDRGVEVLKLPAIAWQDQLMMLLEELGSRGMTNLLIEGGSLVLGAFADVKAIDEIHTFIAPKLAGGRDALSPIGGEGLADMNAAHNLTDVSIEILDGDVHVHGFVAK
jgi:diaminohydroxyphosphoribosylaminopyrimidine deaminase / 5-amino-6-(5-phosphoribosylamino)uracil reductase